MDHLSDEGEQFWSKFRQHIEWSNHCAIFFLVSDDSALTNLIQFRLRTYYQQRNIPLQALWVSNKPNWLLQSMLVLLRQEDTDIVDAPIWLDFNQRTDDKAIKCIEQLLARLNERREALRAARSHPMIFVLPAYFQGRTRLIAPDLWAIRIGSYGLGQVLAKTGPIEELVLSLTDVVLQPSDNDAALCCAKAKVLFQPSDNTQATIASPVFSFTAPIDAIEREELAWYLAHRVWPNALFRERAQHLKEALPVWGEALYKATVGHPKAANVLQAWSNRPPQSTARLSIQINSDDVKHLQNLPWALLRDHQGYLADRNICIRRHLPNLIGQPAPQRRSPVRILLISPRPEDQHEYIDHRASALPLMTAAESFGNEVELDVLSSAYYPALQTALEKAADTNRPYTILHFDGHSVYHRESGIGALCFENPQDEHKLAGRGSTLVDANRLAALLCEHAIPLVFLQTYEAPQSEINPSIPVAIALLQGGVASVVTMNHSIMEPIASQFVTAFYQGLMHGQRIGDAMLAGQAALKAHSYRQPILGAEHLPQDWFIPVLYQEQHDPPLFEVLTRPSDDQQRIQHLGYLPAAPEHTFIGRSRALLKLERLLAQEPFAVILGQGGSGKTTLAVELTRWLQRCDRIQRVAFVCLDNTLSDRSVLDAIGRQWVAKYRVADYAGLTQARQPVERVLVGESCLLLLDNAQTLINTPDQGKAIYALIHTLLNANPDTRLLLTSREILPAPFDRRKNALTLEALTRDEATQLVMQVLESEGLALHYDDEVEPEGVTRLVSDMQGHAQALVLLAREISRVGLNVTTQAIRHRLRTRQQQYPGGRENVLLASVELALQRLSQSQREQVTGLAVFAEGANLLSIAQVLGVANEAAQSLAGQLIAVGLAREQAYGYLRFDPALSLYLAQQPDDTVKAEYQVRWMETMRQLVGFLYQKKSEDARLSSQLTLLQLPNLMVFLRRFAAQAGAADVVDVVGRLEQLLAATDRLSALDEVVGTLQRASELLENHWSHARFASEHLRIERLLQQGVLPTALESAIALVASCRTAGRDAYAEAAYDSAAANFLLGQVFRDNGQAQAALPCLQTAQQQFAALGDASADMAATTLSVQGDCLRDLDQLEAAAEAYEQAILQAEKRNDIRVVAVRKSQLATIRKDQRQYDVALADFEQAKALFTQLQEPLAVASAWHQIGVIHKVVEQFELAETAFRQSLAIKTQQGDQTGEAEILRELGNLYGTFGQLSTTAAYFQEAAQQIYSDVGEPVKEQSIRQSGRKIEKQHKLFKNIFISYAGDDRKFVTLLREKLEAVSANIWVDSRGLNASDSLSEDIRKHIRHASAMIVVLGLSTVNSSWVRKEIQLAAAHHIETIPLLLPGLTVGSLGNWFELEPVAIEVPSADRLGLNQVFDRVLAALKLQLPGDPQPLIRLDHQPTSELTLRLTQLTLHEAGNERRAKAIAQLIYTPAQFSAGVPEVLSREFDFTAPLSPIESDDIRWYLEHYVQWPTGPFKQRAEDIEAKLPQWGQALYHAAIEADTARAVVAVWMRDAQQNNLIERQFSVLVDELLPLGSNADKHAIASEAASLLLALPWELLHQGDHYWFVDENPVRVRRRLPNRKPQNVYQSESPIRILLLSPRPEEAGVAYIDHRASALSLVCAIEQLGNLAALTILNPPTFPALRAALADAEAAGEPFDVVHFDGQGVYRQQNESFKNQAGLGGLCFENPDDDNKLTERRMTFIDAQAMAGLVKDYQIPLVFLEADQTAKSEWDPTTSVAVKLLEEGASSVVAMSHSVLITTATQFVTAFYQALAGGKTIGAAMLAGQLTLYENTWRGRALGIGDFHLQDWFVPVLYQEAQDPILFNQLPSKPMQAHQVKAQKLKFGFLPESPKHAFVGRSRELLALERLLAKQPYAVIRGQGGAGKTTLVVELARWLVRSHRFEQCVFVSLAQYTNARGVLDALGRQLLTDKYSVAKFSSMEEALQPVARTLHDDKTLIVFDHLEKLLPPPSRQSSSPIPNEEVKAVLSLCRTLSRTDNRVRLVFTSREAMLEPFDHKRSEITLGALSWQDAVQLVSQVMENAGFEPKAANPGATPEEIRELVEAVHCHARALVLCAQEVSKQGVRVTTSALQGIMAGLQRQYPDDRERSLFASVELSLRRLPEYLREQINVLAVFHGGANLRTLGSMMDLNKEAVWALTKALIEVGLAEEMPYNHLRLDPALPVYLQGEICDQTFADYQEKWAKAMAALLDFLYEQLLQKDANIAANLTPLELPNLMALLAWAEEKYPTERLLALAGKVEELLVRLDQKHALTRVVALREKQAQQLKHWSHAQFESERFRVERLLDQGDLPAALKAAQALGQCCWEAGEAAYPGADYDIAGAHFLLGKALSRGGVSEAALPQLQVAQQGFQALANAGNEAERMVATAISERGDCLRDLGRLDAAAQAYQTAIKMADKRNAIRDMAVGKEQLGTVRLAQKRCADALAIYHETKTLFNNLGDLSSIAAIWQQIGRVHSETQQFEQAEQAYRASLAIQTQQHNASGEASSLGELGNLYGEMGRLVEAVAFYQQAADIHLRLQDKMKEGMARSNLANQFLALKRYDEARQELHQAIACKKPYGYTAELWKTWNILTQLEQATQHPKAAEDARQKAIQNFSDYRKAGGENHEAVAKLCRRIAQAISENNVAEVEEQLAQYTHDPGWQLFIAKLQAILQGERDPGLADDPDLDYMMVVELRIVLQSLS